MRLQSESRNHGNGVQEKNNVSIEKIRDMPVLVDLDIGPDRLSHHPKRAAQSEQHPEGFLAPIGGDCINEQGPVDKKRHQTKDDVGRCGPSGARGNQLTNDDVSTQQDEPGGSDVPIPSGGGSHSPTDSSVYRKRETGMDRRGTGMTKNITTEARPIIRGDFDHL